jgi:hypothetical protein
MNDEQKTIKTSTSTYQMISNSNIIIDFKMIGE